MLVDCDYTVQQCKQGENTRSLVLQHLSGTKRQINAKNMQTGRRGCMLHAGTKD